MSEFCNKEKVVSNSFVLDFDHGLESAPRRRILYGAFPFAPSEVPTTSHTVCVMLLF